MLIHNCSGKCKHQRGQAVTEFIIVWPVILVAVCFTLQLLWLWWAQQTLDTATQYAVRTGAINHGSHDKMRNTLVMAMAGVKPQLAEQNRPLAAAKAVLEQGIHYALYADLTIKQPSQAQFKQFAKRRWDPTTQRYVREIAVDHYSARQALDSRKAWADARLLMIETQWCEDLVMPLVAEFLGAIAQRRGHCLLGNAQGRPQWPLRSRAQHEMLSGYRQ